jgi:uncharacterized protein YjcR
MRNIARKIWLASGRRMPLRDIADALHIPPGTVRRWKCVDRWADIPKSKGGQAANKNAVTTGGYTALSNNFEYNLKSGDVWRVAYTLTKSGFKKRMKRV